MEQWLGVALPSELRALLREHNGGPTRDFTRPCAVSTYYGGSVVSLDDLWSASSFLDMPYLRREWELPEGLVCFAGPVMAGLFLDYREGRREPAITYYFEGWDQDVLIAPSFRAFFEGLES